MFLLGLLTGIVLAAVVMWLWLLHETNFGLSRPRLFDPRGDLSNIERQTIHQMLAAEMSSQHQDGPGPGDVIDGTASEITRRP